MSIEPNEKKNPSPAGRPGFSRPGGFPLGIIFLALVFTLSGIHPAFAWVNGNFETCNLTGWTTSTNSGNNVACGPPTATSVSVGWAPLSNNMLPRVHGGNCAAQLYSARGDTNHADWARIEQTDTVPTNGSSCLSFWFAAVMEDHHYETGQSEDTYIEADVILGGTTVASLVYNWAQNLTLIVPDGLTGTGGAACPITPTTQNNWGYLPWTNFTIPLCQYAGQSITLQITDYDCGQGGHYGYGYVDDVTWESCPPPVLTLAKANSPNGQVSQGATITYTLNYQNTGAGAADGVVVTDPVPGNSTLVPTSISSNPAVPASQVGGNIVWQVGSLASGASGTLTFKVAANQACVTIINAATEADIPKNCEKPIPSNAVTNWVTGCTPTPQPTFTSTSIPPTFTSTPTRVATATSTSIPPTPSPTPTRPVATVTSTSIGVTPAPTDTPPTSVIATSTSVPPNTPLPTDTSLPTVIATSTSVPPNTPLPTSTPPTRVIATSTSVPPNTSTATSTPLDTFTPALTPTPTPTPTITPTPTQSPTPTWTPTATPTPTPGLRLQKAASVNMTHSGDTVSYNLTLTVLGSAASSIQVVDSLPTQAVFAGFGAPSVTVPGQTMGANGSVLTWTFPFLGPGAYTLPYSVRVNSGLAGGTALVNRAQGFFDAGSSQPVTAQVTVAAPVLVTFNVYNSAGELVKTLLAKPFALAVSGFDLSSAVLANVGGMISISVGGVVVASWDGTNSNGDPVSNGGYLIQASSSDAFGVVTSVTRNVKVDRPISTILVNVYNEAGEIVKHLYKNVADPNASLQSMVLSSDTLKPGNPGSTNPAVSIQVSLSNSLFNVAWDGTSDTGSLVANGRYYVQAHWINNQGGGEQMVTQGITVEKDGGNPAGGQVYAQPNVLTNGQTGTLLKLDSPLSLGLKARIYAVSGELVAVLQGRPGANQVPWNTSGMSSGLYLASVELDGPSGLVSRQTTHILILH